MELPTLCFPCLREVHLQTWKVMGTDGVFQRFVCLIDFLEPVSFSEFKAQTRSSYPVIVQTPLPHLLFQEGCDIRVEN